MLDILIGVLIICVCIIVIAFTATTLILLWNGVVDALKKGKKDVETD